MSRWCSRLVVATCAALCVQVMAIVASAEEIFTGVERIVAVGDVHGDYQQFVRVLRDANVINKKHRWSGGKTHLVQMGDVPDRGPDTRDALDLLMKLEKQARRAGGQVHALIGNHEAMNIVGDLRYVHPGEFAAFVDRKSAARQATYYERTIDYIKRTREEEQWPTFDDDYRAAWEEQFPLGYVEHRTAWSPTGKYGHWVLGNNAVVKINGILFLHGGISPKYADMPLAEINDQVRAALAAPPNGLTVTIIDDELGPLWYRGLAVADDQSPAAREELDFLLAAQQANSVVIAHTPLTGTVVPRFDGRVIDVDVGLSGFYGGRVACLIIEGERRLTLHRGHAIELPRDDDRVVDYLRAAAALDPPPSPIDKYLQRLADAEAEAEAEAAAIEVVE